MLTSYSSARHMGHVCLGSTSPQPQARADRSSDFADQNPDIQVTGTDISPIQPGWTPPNLKLCVSPHLSNLPNPLSQLISDAPTTSEIEDCTQEWTFPPNSADYIHMRWLAGSIPDWNALFAEAYRTCKPGGWVESFEPSPHLESDHGPVPEDSAVGQWGRFFTEGGEKTGRTFSVVDDDLQRKGMEAAGFVDIGEFSFKVSTGASREGVCERERPR